MVFHRPLGDEQRLGDLPVGAAGRGHLGDPQLARGERLRSTAPLAPRPGAGGPEVVSDAYRQRPGSTPGGEVEGLGEWLARGAPLTGSTGIAHFVAAVSEQPGLDVELRELNGRAAAVFRREGRPFAALLLGVSEGKIHRLYFHADVARLRFVGGARSA